MVSLDFVKNGGDGQWYCIDINHSCSSWGEVQEKGGSMEHTIYDHMLNILDETAPDNIENKLKDLDEFILAQL